MNGSHFRLFGIYFNRDYTYTQVRGQGGDILFLQQQRSLILLKIYSIYEGMYISPSWRLYEARE